ncbi:hypothetical protein LTR62_003335 [Meristemomyces frigidus]|uniref:Short-chain dehydrogenase/reductase n=1 Tax=Meristemomyces frigidus TaxID=1508187 RepID=A0AAN7TFR0_9PEZI|nr:hypothetical protein LTR62_003335 [Meristemomyces frigidus]
MVAIQEVRSANAVLKTTTENVTAVFVGATNLHGIGFATIKAFATSIPTPHVIIVGRNATAFAPALAQLQKLNPSGHFTFLVGDISLLKSIDLICKHITQHLETKKINLLYLSQGTLPFAGRQANVEGLDNVNAVRYYGRLRFIQNLLPLMSVQARVVSIMGGTQEGKMLEDDLELAKAGNYTLTQSNNQIATMMTLSFDHLAAQRPEGSFIHVFPGLVSSGILSRSSSGVLSALFAWIVQPVLGLFIPGAGSVGERMLYYGTSEEYAKGSWALDERGFGKEVAVLREYRANGWADRVWEHNLQVFERVLSG